MKRLAHAWSLAACAVSYLSQLPFVKIGETDVCALWGPSTLWDAYLKFEGMSGPTPYAASGLAEGPLQA